MKKDELSRQLAAMLLEEREASVFVQKALATYFTAKPKETFASLARRMGFASRSFVRSLATGKRRPNLLNFRQIAKGLGLSVDATTYLGLLIETRDNDQIGLRAELNASELKLRKSVEKRVL